MSSSSIKNAQNRFSWLEGILNAKIPPTPDMLPYLKDMRTFCSMNAPGFFNKISYNTLQRATLDPKTKYPLNTSARDRWELMKAKREQAHHFLKNVFSPPQPENSEPSERDYKAEIKECLWHASQCSHAYLELYRALKIFLENPDESSSDTDRAKLRSIFDKSRITHLKIISSDPSPEPGNFRVIEGGKYA